MEATLFFVTIVEFFESSTIQMKINTKFLPNNPRILLESAPQQHFQHSREADSSRILGLQVQ